MTNYFNYDPDRQFDLIAFGRVAVDLYGEQIGSKLKNVQSFRKYVGGCAGNIAIGTSRLGLRTRMMSMVGSDEMGQYIADELEKEGVDTELLQTSDGHLTGLVLLGVSPPDRFPLIFYREDCADMNFDHSIIGTRELETTKALLITGTGFSSDHMLHTSMNIIEHARASNTKIILDVDYRPVLWGNAKKGDGESRFVASSQVTNILSAVIPFCDLIVGTEEEIAILSGEQSISLAVKKIHEGCAAPIIIKKGPQGVSCYFSDGHIASSPPYKVEVKNVLGAGDAFMSGLLSGLLKGKSFAESCDRANKAGAIVVTRHGCAPAIPCEKELSDFFES